MQEADLIGEIDHNYFLFSSFRFDLEWIYFYTIIIISSKSLFNFINDNSKLSFIMSESIVANEELKKRKEINS